MIDINYLIESLDKAETAMSEMQEVFSGMDYHNDIKYNFSNREIEEFDKIRSWLIDKKCQLEKFK